MSVFVVHPLGDKSLDITEALSFGDVQYINTRYIYVDELEDGNIIPQSVTNRMLKAVDKFDCDHDYLLIAGDHLQLMAMSALLSARWGWFRVLRYDRQAKGYVPVVISSEEVENGA